jgi:type I restriction enzyme R subunit
MSDPAAERKFQDEIIAYLSAHGWLIGEPSSYDRERALYPEDVSGYVKDTQPEAWKKFCKLHPQEPEKALLDLVTSQLEKADPNATAKDLRRYGTLGVLRNPIKDRGVSLRLCQFKPDHNLNPETLAAYDGNRLRVVQELSYSPYADKYRKKGDKSEPISKDWRIDLVFFINGLPVATVELKSEFKQSAGRAIHQYRKDRLPKDPVSGKPEPLLTFKRGAVVHFAASQFEVAMCTRLDGMNSVFLPFNKGTKEGGAGNDVPEDGSHPTSYLWKEVLQRDTLLKILGRYVHLQVEEKEDWQGKKFKKESLIFPRYHQLDLVSKLVDTASAEGPGHCYLVQHSAGSGKSNSIAWVAHQLSSLHDQAGEKVFHSAIVITDRTVLDSQLQDTIYQFEHREGVVGRINREEGDGTKSEKLAEALIKGQPIIIVTIQTFPFVLEAIQKSTTLKKRNFAIIADEAHSSQTGSTARKLREVLMVEQHDEEEKELSAEDMLDMALEARRGSKNLSYFAFTATPKPRTMELFGRLPDPTSPPSKDNLPEAFHVYSMRQAIEEKFILDVLRNYTTYGTAYKLAQKNHAADEEIDSKKASKELSIWIKLHPHNIGQRVQVIVEHFRKHVQSLLGGQAKAMVVTSSRIEAVRYKLAFDKYLQRLGYKDLRAMVAFSGEVVDAESGDFAFNERNMNPELKGRDMRKAFDTSDYQVMIVANKFQTGFDQPKLCAMYVLKRLSGVDCVQTLSRLNRTYPGKEESGTFVLDFVNDPEEILESFKPYHKTATLADVSDPNQVHVMFDKLGSAEIYQWSEVEQFAQIYFDKKKSDLALSSICKPARDRWRDRYATAAKDLKQTTDLLKRAKKSGDAVLVANAVTEQRDAKGRKDSLDLFKKDLSTFARFYEFISQIVDFDDRELEKLNLYARHLYPLLREEITEDDDTPDLDNVQLTHYRLQKQLEQDLMLSDGHAALHPGGEFGTGKDRDKKIEPFSVIINRMNDLFAAENLSDADKVSYAETICAKIRENSDVMAQVRNNTPEQAMLGDFPQAVLDAVLASGDAHHEIMSQFLANKNTQIGFARMLLEMLSKSA